jgi:hypothetical protein
MVKVIHYSKIFTMNQKKLYQSTIYYDRLNDQNSDKVAHYLDSQIKNIPTTLINHLPVNISIFLEKKWSHKIYFIGIIKEKSTFKISFDLIEDGDLLHFKDSTQQNFILKSHIFIRRLSSILLGNVTTSTKTFKRNVHPGADLSSVNMYNMLPFPLAIYMATGNTVNNKKADQIGGQTTFDFGKNTPAVLLDANNFLGSPEHHGDRTMAPTVYFDNLGFGINIGTIFYVFAIMREKKLNEMSTNKKVYLYAFMINSTDNTDIFIGDISPIIGESNFTEVSPPLHEKNTTGRAIYRLGEEQDSMGNVGNMHFPTGERMITPKNYPPLDKPRNSMNNHGVYATVPSAKYRDVSGKNVHKTCG